MFRFFIKLLRLLGLWPKEKDEALANQCIAEFDSAFASLSGRYITYKERQKIKATLSIPYKQAKSIHLPKQHDTYTKLQQIIAQYDRLDKIIEEHNEDYIKNELRRCDSLLSDIDGKSLDSQQRMAVVMDADRNLVLAGAGSGKTLTIAGKVNYLCQEKGIPPEEILLIAFTKKSAGEMTERIQKLGFPVKATTFHKLGLDIITSFNGTRPDVQDNLRKFVKDYFENTVLTNPLLVKLLIEYFAYYLHIPANLEDFSSLGELYEHEKGMDLETLNSKYKRMSYVKEAAVTHGTAHKSLKDEVLKSSEEVTIANFLFLHGIEYEYEPLYPHRQEDGTRKPYRPDFYLPEYGIYLEHFGVNKYGKAPWLSEMEEKKYQEGMKWKRDFHRKHGTRLIETYSYYSSEGRLQEKLEELLLKNGVRFKEPDFLDIFNTIYAKKGDKYFSEFINICCTFITLFKSNGYELDALDDLKYADKKYQSSFFLRRTFLFKQIIKPIMSAYNEDLRNQGSVDFSDMINHAAKIVSDSGHTLHPYKWVIIDEYQDISVARFKLVDAILKQTDAKLLCVGDDWQSIYRFAGSDISLFTKFTHYFGPSVIMRIEQTYRNSQQLIDAAGSFVMQNPLQMKKSLRSQKTLEYPLSFMCYNQDPIPRLLTAIRKCISGFGAEASVMLLGRTQFDLDMLKGRKEFTVKSDNTIIFHESPTTPITFMTVHKSKGLEADNVILLNFQNAVLGFPNKISDDPLLELVLTQSDEYEYAEERRLLYVALTRTKNRTFILVDETRASAFFKEFPASDTTFILSSNSGNAAPSVSCPRCKTGKLIIRENEATHEKFIGCSHYPHCGYTVNDATALQKNHRCPRCGGFLVKRHSQRGDFYGCSNYPLCDHTQNAIYRIAGQK